MSVDITEPRQLSPKDFRLLRQSRGLSLASLGAQIGTSKTHLSLAERGLRRLSPDLEMRLLRALWGPRA